MLLVVSVPIYQPPREQQFTFFMMDNKKRRGFLT